MAVKTRSQKKASLSRRRLYRSRVKRSTCRKARSCRVAKGCRLTKSGKRKAYCRKVKNTRKMKK